MASTPQASSPTAGRPEAIAAVLDPAESVELWRPRSDPLVLTQHRLFVVRDGASFRPKTGVRTFELGSGLRSGSAQLESGSSSIARA